MYCCKFCSTYFIEKPMKQFKVCAILNKLFSMRVSVESNNIQGEMLNVQKIATCMLEISSKTLCQL